MLLAGPGQPPSLELLSSKAREEKKTIMAPVEGGVVPDYISLVIARN
jgi:hypothetical protein